MNPIYGKTYQLSRVTRDDNVRIKAYHTNRFYSLPNLASLSVIYLQQYVCVDIIIYLLILQFGILFFSINRIYYITYYKARVRSPSYASSDWLTVGHYSLVMPGLITGLQRQSKMPYNNI